MKLTEISERRLKTAQKIITKLNLLEILSEVGRPHLVGSVALGTVMKLDIDFHIHLNKHYTPKKAVEYIKKHLTDPRIRDIAVCTYAHLDGLVMDFKYKSRGEWSVDMYLCNKEPDSVRHEKWIKSHLTLSNLKLILRLKYHYLRKKLLRMGMSYWIYEGVLKNNVKTPTQFEKYLLEKKNLKMDYFRKSAGKKKL